jgi:Membrane-associated lipoprotein involved in thiamine biosynthesis
MKRIFPLLCAALMLSSLCACGSAQPETSELFAMDTVMNLTAYGSGAKTALDASSDAITGLEDRLSRTKSDSEITAVNNAAGSAVTVDSDVAALVSSALTYSAATGGAFDITIAPVVTAWGFTTGEYRVPSQSELAELLKKVDSSRVTVSGDAVALGAGQSIDLGGIAKGYTSDVVEGIFRDDGIASGMISLGGNVYVRGSKPDGSAWRVAVQDPSDSSSYVGVLKLTDAFAVTSGGYQRYFEENGVRYHHIIDPATGSPAENGLISVTIVADANGDDAKDNTPGNGTMCDAFSTALFVMGTDKAEEFWRTGKYPFGMVLVTSDGRVLVTSDIADRFEEAEGSGYSYEVVS